MPHVKVILLKPYPIKNVEVGGTFEIPRHALKKYVDQGLVEEVDDASEAPEHFLRATLKPCSNKPAEEPE